MKVSTIAVMALLLMGGAGAGHTAVLDMQLDGYAGNAAATVEACGKIAPVGTKRLADAIAKAVKQEKQTMEALRASPGYVKEFKKESTRWYYMSEKNRYAACRKLNETEYP